MTINEFNISFKKFLDYYPSSGMTKELTNIYFLALSDLTTEQLDKAFMKIVRDRVYSNFPQVAEIRNFALGTTENDLNARVNLAREKIKFAIRKYGAYQSVKFDDKGIHAFIDSLGGWRKICEMEMKEFENLFKYKNFKETYVSYWRMPYNTTEHYIGIIDHENNTENVRLISNIDMGVGVKKSDLIENQRKQIKVIENG